MIRNFVLISSLLACSAAAAIQVDIFDRKTHTEYSIHGAFKKGDGKILATAYEKAVKRKKKISIWMTNEGGILEDLDSINQALEKIIEAEFKKYSKPTPFVIYEDCASLCHFITANIAKKFPRDGGKVEFLTADETKFYFHQPTDSEGNAFTGAELEERMGRFTTALLKSGVDEEWLKENSTLFKSSEGETILGAKICAGNSHIVPADSCRVQEKIPKLIEEVLEK